jgi:two-component SAPR family response regulator
MIAELEHAWIYGQYIAYWQYAWADDERQNSQQMYEQIIAETLEYC